ncbi:hypothetical protein PENSUB_9552 [Penicillium subrubescens]|uniref:Uncharacterized protein n=1 Tax=Penicillium subrubescens TaxID=1316194 RepID=A0A1Q5TCK8_9EURO|nr:hypothetical protein PENSUB_9552 [Penicillium subrubescens]
MLVDVAKRTDFDQSFPRFEAAEERRIRDVDLDVRFIDNHPARIPFVVKLSHPLFVAAASQSKVITSKRVVVYNDRLCISAASLVIPVRQTLIGVFTVIRTFSFREIVDRPSRHTLDARGAKATDKDIIREFLTFGPISLPEGRRAESQSPNVLPPLCR